MRKYRRQMARYLLKRDGWLHVNRWMCLDWRRILEQREKILTGKRHRKLRKKGTT